MDTYMHNMVTLPKALNLRRKQCKMNIIACKASQLSRGNETNLYKVLSLESENVGFDEIKKAYRSMALQCHPDVCHPSGRKESTQKFVELRRAYETLSDPTLRMRYDCQLHSLSVSSDKRGSSSRYPKEVWEVQLFELKRRSNERVARKKRSFL